jgi:U1 small nuclear ribonucleoprotein 70kDa
MTDKLPPNLLQLFTARPPLRYLPPSDIGPEKRKTTTVSGIAAFLSAFEHIDDEYDPSDTAEQAKERRRAAKLLRNQKLLREGVEKCTKPDSWVLRGELMR